MAVNITGTSLGNALKTVIEGESDTHFVDDNEKTAISNLPGDTAQAIASLQAQVGALSDEVLEYADQAAFPATGDSSLLYVALDENKIYRWSGSAYALAHSAAAVVESGSLADFEDSTSLINSQNKLIGTPKFIDGVPYYPTGIFPLSPWVGAVGTLKAQPSAQPLYLWMQDGTTDTLEPSPGGFVDVPTTGLRVVENRLNDALADFRNMTERQMGNGTITHSAQGDYVTLSAPDPASGDRAGMSFNFPVDIGVWLICFKMRNISTTVSANKVLTNLYPSGGAAFTGSQKTAYMQAGDSGTIEWCMEANVTSGGTLNLLVGLGVNGQYSADGTADLYDVTIQRRDSEGEMPDVWIDPSVADTVTGNKGEKSVAFALDNITVQNGIRKVTRGVPSTSADIVYGGKLLDTSYNQYLAIKENLSAPEEVALPAGKYTVHIDQGDGDLTITATTGLNAAGDLSLNAALESPIRLNLSAQTDVTITPSGLVAKANLIDGWVKRLFTLVTGATQDTSGQSIASGQTPLTFEQKFSLTMPYSSSETQEITDSIGQAVSFLEQQSSGNKFLQLDPNVGQWIFSDGTNAHSIYAVANWTRDDYFDIAFRCNHITGKVQFKIYDSHDDSTLITPELDFSGFEESIGDLIISKNLPSICRNYSRTATDPGVYS